MTSPMKQKLRVGLLMDSLNIPAWAYHMLERIKGSNYAEISLIVLNDSLPPRREVLISRIVKNWNSLLFVVYMKTENLLFKPSPDAFQIKDAGFLLANIPTIKVRPRQTKFSDRIENGDIGEIERHKIDVFVRLGFRILRGRILKASRYGVWSYHHGDNDANRGGPAGFWEVFEKHPVTGSILQVLSEELDNGLILYKSHSATDTLSVKRNRNNYYWKSMSFLPRKLEELHESGPEQFFNRLASANNHASFYSNRLYTAPKNVEFGKALSRHMLTYCRFKIDNLAFSYQWILMFDLRDGLSHSLWRFKKIIPPADRFWADPHVLHKDDRYYIFVEEFIYQQNKGHISLIVMDESGNYSQPRKILDKPYHLSYPYVFEWRGEYFMIPETSANRTIEVYRCTEFPHKWEFERILMENLAAFDATLFCHDHKWWLFANVRENEGASSWDELFLFYSDSPLSNNWVKHPQNPIVSDVRKSRTGGSLFEYNGNVYRPSQDCSEGYGYGLRVNQIIKLNEREYEENEVSSIEPKWDKNIRGIHTLNQTKRLTVIDAKLKRCTLLM